MARKCEQLLVPDRPNDCMAPSHEALWVESRLKFPVAAGVEATPADIVAMSCVFVDLARSAETAEQLALLAASLRSVYVWRDCIGPGEPGRQLASALSFHDDDIGHAVLLLDDGAGAAVHPRPIIDALRPSSGAGAATSGLVVAVAAAPSAVARIRGIDGFVVAEPGRGAAVAAQLVSMFAALLAPDVGLCMDQEDFAGALGSASRPSRIVEAWWLAARDELVFASTPDERTVAQATDVAAFVFSRQSTRTGPVVRAIRASLDRAASVTFAEPIGLLVDAGADDSRVLVRLLCGCDGHTGSD